MCIILPNPYNYPVEKFWLSSFKKQKTKIWTKLSHLPENRASVEAIFRPSCLVLWPMCSVTIQTKIYNMETELLSHTVVGAWAGHFKGWREGGLRCLPYRAMIRSEVARCLIKWECLAQWNYSFVECFSWDIPDYISLILCIHLMNSVI